MITTNKQGFFLSLLFIIIIVLFTTYYEYPWHPDHYTLGQYTHAVIEKGYAPWILHPLSLFGYYPLSIPSGFEYFFSVLSNISSLDLPILFYMFSVFSALFAVSGVYLVMRGFSSFETSFLAAFIFSTSAYFVKNVSNTASSRMFNIIFYPLFIFIFFKIIKVYREEHKISIKYIITNIILFVIMNLIHRFGQLLIIFIISFFAALIFTNLDHIVKWIKTLRIYKIRKTFYEYSPLFTYLDLEVIILILFSFSIIKIKLIWIITVFVILIYYFWFNFLKIKQMHRSKHLLFFDILILIFYVGLAKTIDLIARGRFAANFFRIIEKYSFQLTLIGVVLLSFFTIGIFFIFKRYKNMKNFLNFIENKSLEIVQKEPKKLISWVLLLIMLFFISRNFSGDNFYRFGFEHYTDSFLLKGTSPWIIMVNFIFNLNNNVTILIYFAIIGVFYIFLKEDKTFYDYFFIFVAIGFSQFLLDWEYIRLYIIPIYAIFIGIGLTFLIKKLSNKFNRKIIYMVLILLITAHLIISNIFIQRERILPKFGIVEGQYTIPEVYFIASGNYLFDKGDVSIHTSSSIEYDSKAGYYAKKISSVLAQSTLTENKNYEFEEISFNDILNSFKRGEKVTEIYKLRDEIYGGYYYFGRHIYNLNKREITDGNVAKTIQLYNIRFIVDSPYSKEKTEFFQSIYQIKNKVYSSSGLNLYDLSMGR